MSIFEIHRIPFAVVAFASVVFITVELEETTAVELKSTFEPKQIESKRHVQIRLMNDPQTLKAGGWSFASMIWLKKWRASVRWNLPFKSYCRVRFSIFRIQIAECENEELRYR